MKQSFPLRSKVGEATLFLPAADEEVMPGVSWGIVATHGTPANRLLTISQSRMERPQMRMFSRWTLSQGIGWHLIVGDEQNDVGHAAFRRLDALGAFGVPPPNADQLTRWLDEPLTVWGHPMPQRCACTPETVTHLATALEAAAGNLPPYDARGLRDWLATLPGIDLLGASWVVRYILGPDTIAVIDRCLLRSGQDIGLFSLDATLDNDYLALEALTLDFCDHVGIGTEEWHASILDDMEWRSAEIEARVQAKRAARTPLPAIRSLPSKARAPRTRGTAR